MDSPLSRALMLALAVGALALSGPSIAQTGTASGFVDEPPMAHFCQPGTHPLVDPCTGEIHTWLQADFPLDEYLCRHVRVSGVETGIECPVILITEIELTEEQCPLHHMNLQVHDPQQTWFAWGQVACDGGTYDLIRGDLPSILGEHDHIDLGVVICLLDDYRDRTTEHGPSDPDRPVAGEAFFYLVRTWGARIGVTTYGFSSDSRERIASGGDCSTP